MASCQFAKQQPKSPTRSLRAAGTPGRFWSRTRQKFGPRGRRRPRTPEPSRGPARGSLSPRRRRTTKGRVCPSGAGRAGRGAGRLLSLRSSRKLGQRRGGAVSVGAPRPAGSPMRRDGTSGTRRGARVARAPRHGGRVWEVRASAFEVELLPCLNYVRPSVRSGPGAEARPPGGAGGARGRCSAQVRAAGGAWVPEPGALRSFEEWRSAAPHPGPPAARAEVSGLREVAAAEPGGACGAAFVCLHVGRAGKRRAGWTGRALKHGAVRSGDGSSTPGPPPVFVLFSPFVTAGEE